MSCRLIYRNRVVKAGWWLVVFIDTNGGRMIQYLKNWVSLGRLYS